MKKIISFPLVMFLFVFCLFMFNKNIEARPYFNGAVDIDHDYGIGLAFSISNPSYNIDEDGDGYPETPVYRVEDSGHLDSDQPMALIDLTDFGISTGSIYYGGFTTLIVIFQLDIREVYDGYQSFYVFNPNATNNPDLVNPYLDFDYGESETNTTFSRFEFYAEIPRTMLTSKYVAIGFDAHGAFFDDWEFKNLEVQICTSMNTRNITDLCRITNGV